MPTALVIGGTGPTGPGVVDGLLVRGYDVTVLHGGQHEVPLPDAVPHLHADPHFAAPLRAALGTRTFDLVVAQYGRLRILADELRGRTTRLIAIGGATASLAAPEDPRWGRLGRPAITGEADEVLEDDIGRHTFGYRMADAERALFMGHDAGAYEATYLGYPILYGPRQIQPHDWCIVRRLLEGRRRLIIADGGLKLESRLFVTNAIAAVLRTVDRPEDASGQKFIVADEAVHDLRQRILGIASCMGVDDLELVDMPYELAVSCHPFWRNGRGHRLRRSHKIRAVLGHVDAATVDDGLQATVQWLLDHPPAVGGPEETRLADPFDYAAEDAAIAEWESSTSAQRRASSPLPAAPHPYRHPGAVGETWALPTHTMTK